MPEVFGWIPQVEPQGQTTFRVRSAQFGDGYTQTVTDGINNRVDSWPLSFDGDGSYVSPIKDFLDRHAGAASFQWTPPLGAPALFRCAGYTLVPRAAGYYTLSATFQQVFAP
ncbi:phage tail protein [Dyella sp. BiH032]|uniref:phage tail protein n=1 Tax=Dyella sp. BiH032 TaxID=3075430 RepID=UPI002892B7B9|nr:phage tail protein [Dyella sp. BiH032]WNL45962.1 phage tail protein [Dyella sp. BiH032]